MTNTGILLQKIDAGVNKVAQEVPFSRRKFMEALIFTASVPTLIKDASAKDVKDGFDLLGIKEKKIPVVPLAKIIDNPLSYKEKKFITDGFLKPETQIKLNKKEYSLYDVHVENKDDSLSILGIISNPSRFGIERVTEENKKKTVFDRTVIQGEVQSVKLDPADIPLGNVIIAERAALIK